MTDDEILEIANALSKPAGYVSEVMDVKTVGVAGDKRTYAPVIKLTKVTNNEQSIDYTALAKLSTTISNNTGGCRIVLDISDY